MATITFLGESFEVDHAVKGEDYVHGYDAAGHCIISIDGVKDFSLITYDGVYMNPRECLSEPCNSVKYCGGTLKTADGEVINKLDVLWANASPTSDFAAQTITIDPFDDYNFFILECRMHGDSGYRDRVSPVLIYNNTQNQVTTPSGMFAHTYQNSAAKWCSYERTFSLTPYHDNGRTIVGKLTFGTAYYNGSSDDGALIPLSVLATKI